MKRKSSCIWILAVVVLVVLSIGIAFAPFLMGFVGEYVAGGGGYESAVDLATMAIRMRPGYAYPYTVRAEAHMQLGDLELALQDYDRAVALDPEEWLFYGMRANLFRAMGRPDAALTDYTRSIELNPANVDALVNRGRVLAVVGKYTEAIADFTTAIAVDPECADAYLGRGIVWQVVSDLEKARTDFAEAARLYEAQGLLDEAEMASTMLHDMGNE